MCGILVMLIFLNLNRELDWSLFLVNESDIDVAYEKWYRQFRCFQYIPFKTVTIRPNDKPWMNGRNRLSIRKRNCFLKMHNKKSTLNLWECYHLQHNHTTYLIRNAKKVYCNSMQI